MTRRNIVGKIRLSEYPFHPIVRLDENKNDSRITGLSVDILRGLDMFVSHHFNNTTNEGTAR